MAGITPFDLLTASFRDSDRPAGPTAHPHVETTAAETSSETISTGLAQELITRLFAAGLDLHAVLGRLQARSDARDASAAARIRTAADKLDAVIVRVRDVAAATQSDLGTAEDGGPD